MVPRLAGTAVVAALGWQLLLVRSATSGDSSGGSTVQHASSPRLSRRPRTWSGPALRADLSGPVAGLRIGGNLFAPAVPASWLTLNSIGSDDALVMAAQSSRVGMKVIEVVVVGGLPNRTSPMPAGTLDLWRRVVRASGNATVILRVSLSDMVDGEV